jgi:hypothetical protein
MGDELLAADVGLSMPMLACQNEAPPTTVCTFGCVQVVAQRELA